MKTVINKLIQDLKERQSFLENTDCISESLEVKHIITLANDKIDDEYKQLHKAFNHGKLNAITSNDLDKTRKFNWFYKNI